jgi:hypothetical protein
MTVPGFGRCRDCKGRVLFALAVTGEVIAFDAAFEDGPWSVAWDITRTPRCRPVGKSGHVRDGEYLYRQHAVACPAVTEPVAPVEQLRRPLRRQVRSASPRKAASAR